MEIKKNLILLHVPEGSAKPYGCSRGFFMRIGANSQKMTRNEIINFFKKEGRFNFEELINEKADFERDFDPKAFQRFLKLSGISSIIKQETLLQNLDCLTPDKKLTNLGVLFFAKDIDFIMNYALVDCILFGGTDKVKILDRKQYKGNLIENIENALAFIQRHTNTEYLITGKLRREEISDYPETALREALINAVCHRDYFERRCPVVIEVFSDRVEIYNPGGLPNGLDPKDFGTKSVPRNLLIASMLHRTNYIERAGTGIARIKKAVANYKKKIHLDIQYSKNSLFYNVIFRKNGSTKNLSNPTQKTPLDTTKKTLLSSTQKTPLDTTKKTPNVTQKATITNKKPSSSSTQKTPLDTTKKTLLSPTQKTPLGATKKTPSVTQKATITNKKPSSNSPQKASLDVTQYILNLIKKNPLITRQQLAKEMGYITSSGVKYHLERLKKQGILKRIGPKKGGYWKIIKSGFANTPRS